MKEKKKKNKPYCMNFGDTQVRNLKMCLGVKQIGPFPHSLAG